MLETVFRLAMHFDLHQNLRCHRQAFLSLESLLSGYGTRIRSYGALSKSIHSTGHSLLWPYPYPLYTLLVQNDVLLGNVLSAGYSSKGFQPKCQRRSISELTSLGWRRLRELCLHSTKRCNSNFNNKPKLQVRRCRHKCDDELHNLYGSSGGKTTGTLQSLMA
jgi:hypothetical protein